MCLYLSELITIVVVVLYTHKLFFFNELLLILVLLFQIVVVVQWEKPIFIFSLDSIVPFSSIEIITLFNLDVESILVIFLSSAVKLSSDYRYN